MPGSIGILVSLRGRRLRGLVGRLVLLVLGVLAVVLARGLRRRALLGLLALAPPLLLLRLQQLLREGKIA